MRGSRHGWSMYKEAPTDSAFPRGEEHREVLHRPPGGYFSFSMPSALRMYFS